MIDGLAAAGGARLVDSASVRRRIPVAGSAKPQPRLPRRHHPHNPSPRPLGLPASRIKGSRLIRIDRADVDALLRPIPSAWSCGGGLNGGVFPRIPTFEPPGEARGERVGEVSGLPWSPAWTHGREPSPMPSITQAGVTPRELDSLVDGELWRAWCRARPELADFDSLATIRRLKGAAEDQALGALLWLAAADGGDDQLAAVAVLHQLGGSVRVIARHFWHAAEGEAYGTVAGAMWEQIRAYHWCERNGRHAAAV